MKSKIVVLGICTLLSACGLGSKRGGVSVEEENTSPMLLLTNLKTQNYSKLQQLKSGNQFRYLGTVDASSVPTEIRGLPSESEIGTLSVEFEDEIYAEKYDDEVKPVFKTRQQEIKTTVYLIKESGSPAQVSFVIKDDEFGSQVSVRETPITVASSPVAYCSRARFYLKQLKDGEAILEREADCYPSGLCNVAFRIDSPISHDEYHVYPYRGAEESPACLEFQLNYTVHKTEVNRFVPKVATVVLDAEISKMVKTIKFDL